MTAMTRAPSPWKAGDFHIIGREHVIVGEMLCDDCDLGAGNTVLDVACGSGNTALAAARRRNRVTGLDPVESLMKRGKQRAQAEGFDIQFIAGTAEDLPFADGSFDVVLSTFGAIFAPDHQRTADELLRVCKPGGVIGLAAWTIESMPAAMFGVTAKYMQAPPPGRPPSEWGTAHGLMRLFGDRVEKMRLYDRAMRSRFVSLDAWFGEFREYFGPVHMTYESLDAPARAAFELDMRETAAQYNRATDGTISLAMSYVNVVMEKGRSG